MYKFFEMDPGLDSRHVRRVFQLSVQVSPLKRAAGVGAGAQHHIHGRGDRIVLSACIHF